jgi:hypothetical protein
MRINASGLGFSKTGVNGPYTNAFVFDSVKGGHLIADFITAGHMKADRIQGGTLESIDSTTIGGVAYKNFSLNMTTGAIEALKLSIKSANFTLDYSGNIIASNAKLTGADVEGTIAGYGYPSSSSNREGAIINGGKISFKAYLNPDNTGGNELMTIHGNNIYNPNATGSGAYPVAIQFYDYGIELHATTGSGTILLDCDKLETRYSGNVYEGDTGYFYDKDGNQITVRNGLIVDGI